MGSQDEEFTVIEFSMMNTKVFYPLSGLGSFTVQTLLYPLVLLRTRLQLQEGVQVYRGLAHATASVLRDEGFRGLYSGYFVKTVQILTTVLYASTYETVRHAASAYPNLSPSQRSFLGGASASLVAQTMLVPIDVVSQHLMVLPRRTPTTTTTTTSSNSPNTLKPHGKKLLTQTDGKRPSINQLQRIRALSAIQLTNSEYVSNWSRFRAIIDHIVQTHGIRGFYNGYLISLCTFVPSSALWWAFYDKFCRVISSTYSHVWLRYHASIASENNNPTSPSDLQIPRLPIQLMSGSLAGITAATIINPIDCVRVRMQVGHQPFRDTVHNLWHTEGFRWFAKGLSARVLQSGIYSFWLVLIYEPVKMFCLKDEFRNKFKNRSDW